MIMFIAFHVTTRGMNGQTWSDTNKAKQAKRNQYGRTSCGGLEKREKNHVLGISYFQLLLTFYLLVSK